MNSNTRPACPSRSKCRRQVYALKKKIKRLTKEKEEMVHTDKIFSSNPYFRKLIQSQIVRYQNKRLPYSLFEKSAAISMFYACGRQGYRYTNFSKLSFKFKLLLKSNLILLLSKDSARIRVKTSISHLHFKVDGIVQVYSGNQHLSAANFIQSCEQNERQAKGLRYSLG